MIRPRLYKDKKGVALIFIAAMLLAAGVIIAIGISVLRPGVEQEKRLDTKKRIEVAKDAVIGFAALRDRLPNETEFRTLVRELDDIWGNELIYWADDNLDDDTSTVCGRSTTDTTIVKCYGDAPNDCVPQQFVLNSLEEPDEPDAAFVILSSGENLNLQTLVNVDTSSATASATIQTYSQGLFGVDDVSAGLNRLEPYKDIVEWVNIRELKEKAGCSSNLSDEFNIITSSIPYGTVETDYSAGIIAANGVPWDDTQDGSPPTSDDGTDPDYRWCVTESLPTGLSYSCNGTLNVSGVCGYNSDVDPPVEIGIWEQCTHLEISGGPQIGTEGTYPLPIYARDNNNNLRMKTFPLSILPNSLIHVCPAYRLWKHNESNDADAYLITGESCITNVNENFEITTPSITLNSGETISSSGPPNSCTNLSTSATFLDAVLADGNKDCCINYTASGPPDYTLLVDRTCPGDEDADGDGFDNSADCDDNDPSVYPGAIETCDFVDQDCDGEIDDGFDNDEDNYTSCGGDCDDTDEEINPVAIESCDGVDEDCDGKIDDGFDNDNDNYTSCGGDCNDTDALINPDADDNDCNDVDEDCDGDADDGYPTTPTSCGNGACADNGDITCQSGSEVDTCTVGPPDEATDVTCDGIDGDCDGFTDEDYVVIATICGDGVCAAGGLLECQEGLEADTCVPGPQAEATDVTCDGVDGDCDASIDEDYVIDSSCGTGYCLDNNTPSSCFAGVETGCQAATPAEATDVTCDGIDGDCDGLIDEDYVVTPTSCGIGACSASGQLECQAGIEVDTCVPGPQNELADVTCDGIDGDCDGATDEDYVIESSCGTGYCLDNNTPSSCVGGVETGCQAATPAELTDVTCDGVDGDCDGFIDEDYAVDSSCGTGACQDNNTSSTCVGGIETLCLPALPSEATDVTCDGIDGDCDGATDEEYVIDSSCGVGVCQANNAPSTCVGGVETVCVQGDPTGDDIICDGIDENCNGSTDENYIVDSSCGTGACQDNNTSSTCVGGVETICQPGLPSFETCNNVDDDCDGIVDTFKRFTACGIGECGAAGAQICETGSWGADTCTPGAPVPEDNFDDDGNGTTVCTDTLDNDCDELIDWRNDPDCPGRQQYCDDDNDTFFNAAGNGICFGAFCWPDRDYTGCREDNPGDDCNDGDPFIHPGADDILCNGVDNNCNGTPDDGYVVDGSCGTGYCLDNNTPSTCVGGVETGCQAAPPVEGTDVTCDGVDGDCDGSTDEDYAITPTSCGAGACSESGQLECQAGIEVDTCVPGPQDEASDETCDGVDGDCDGATDEDYVVDSSCGDGVCQTGNMPSTCVGGVETICQDGPQDEASDETCDGVDGDCDGLIDEDYVITPTSCGDGVCSASGQLECQAGIEVDTCVVGPQDEASDETCDGVDGDCDGATDEDYVIDSSCGTGACQDNNAPSTCVAGVETGCLVGPQDEASDETCDGVDGDCDGLTDEDYVIDSSCGTGYCLDNNTSSTCVGGVETGCQAASPAEVTDVTCDGIDGDCDGLTDEDYAITPTSCGDGVCSAGGQLECQAGSEVDTCTPGPQDEPSDITCDGVDGDCDGATDEDYVIDSSCGTGYCLDNNTSSTCVGGVETGCQAATPAEVTDVTCDGVDGDCDGSTDEDYAITPTVCGDGICSASGQIECQAGVEVDTCLVGPQDEPSDVTCDGVDGDCDGATDEDYVIDSSCGTGYCLDNNTSSTCVGGVETGCQAASPAEVTDVTCDGVDGDCDGATDEDYVITGTNCGDGECSINTGQLECQAGSEVDTCDPFAGAAADDTVCDGLDEDCDGSADEDYVTTPSACGVGECIGNTGQIECQVGSEVDTCDPFAGAAADDTVCDTLDEDCDGSADEDYVTTPSACGVGVCASSGQLSCQAGSEVDTCSAGSPTETPESSCSDGLDNDCDGLTDDFDDDCDPCVLVGLDLTNATGQTRRYNLNGGISCTSWPNGSGVHVDKPDSVEIYKDKSNCSSLKCTEGYDSLRSYDADDDCMVQLDKQQPSCEFSDK